MVQDVTDLRVYQRALSALRLIYRLASQLPKDSFKLKTQLTSAAEGVPANIAEGFAKRKSAKEFRRFLMIAMGSSDEVITHARSIEIRAETYPHIDPNLTRQVKSTYKIISKQLNTLSKNWIDYRHH